MRRKLRAATACEWRALPASPIRSRNFQAKHQCWRHEAEDCPVRSRTVQSHFILPRETSIICLMATEEPGARRSRSYAMGLQVSTIPEYNLGILKAARQVGTMVRIRSHTTQTSP